jgi:cytochrome c553
MLKILLTFLISFYLNAYAETGLEKLAVCASCHGIQGQSPQDIWPNLAGQSPQYLLKQLQDYQTGKRTSVVMQTYAKLLNEKEMSELSKYYSSQIIKSSAKFKKPQSKAELLYKIGNSQQKVPACIACHGLNGQGNGPAKYPKLSQQHQTYLEQQLKAFKTKERQNDPHQIMQDISSRLSESDIQELSDYLSHSLH